MSTYSQGRAGGKLFKLIYYHAILALSQKWLLAYSYLPIELGLERVGLHSVFGYKNSFHVEELQAARENVFFLLFHPSIRAEKLRQVFIKCSGARS